MYIAVVQRQEEGVSEYIFTKKSKIQLFRKYKAVLYYEYVGQNAQLIKSILGRYLQTIICKTDIDSRILLIRRIVDKYKKRDYLSESITWCHNSYVHNTYGLTDALDFLRFNLPVEVAVAHIQWNYRDSPIRASEIISKLNGTTAEQIAYVTEQIQTFRTQPDSHYIRISVLGDVFWESYDSTKYLLKWNSTLYIAIFDRKQVAAITGIYDEDVQTSKSIDDLIAKLGFGLAKHRSSGDENHPIVELFY